MYVAKYNPVKEIQEFKKGFENFNSFLDTILEKRAAIAKTDFTPTVNTREGEDAYYVEVDLPGVKKDDMNIDVKDNILTISGERKIEKEDSEKDYYQIESSYGKFERSFSLPDNVDVEGIQAESKDGVLEVVIPKVKKEAKKAKKIEIK